MEIINNYDGERLGIASLMFWAKNDNEKMYIKAKFINPYI